MKTNLITNARFTHLGRLKLLETNLAKRKEDSDDQVYKAVDLLIYVQCLVLSTYDLRRSLERSGLLKYNVKKLMTRLDIITADVSRAGYDIFSKRAGVGPEYAEKSEEAYNIILKSIEGTDDEFSEVSKYLSITKSLLDLIESYNRTLCPKFRFSSADKFIGLSKLLSIHLKFIKLNDLSSMIVKTNVNSYKLGIRVID